MINKKNVYNLKVCFINDEYWLDNFSWAHLVSLLMGLLIAVRKGLSWARSTVIINPEKPYKVYTHTQKQNPQN